MCGKGIGPFGNRFESGPHILLMNDDNENEDDRKVVGNNDKVKTAESVQDNAKESKTVKNGEEANE